MKKTLITLMTLSALTACNNDETLDVVSSQPITFSNAFVGNSTRAAIDGSYQAVGTEDGKLSKFQVYGTISNGTGEDIKVANIFNGTEVTYASSKWGYNNPQYWIPGNTYNFTAIVDGNVVEGEGQNKAEITSVITTVNNIPTTIFLNDASKQKDIMYASVDPITNVTESYDTPVKFTFSHLLAKAKVTVKNTIPTTTTGYTYKVSDVKITGAQKNGLYSIETASWSSFDGEKAETYNVEFGNIVTAPSADGVEATAIENTAKDGVESNWERLMIPVVSTPISISFKSELYINDVLVQTKNETAQAAGVTLTAGHSYNFVIELGVPGNPITFEVEELPEWVTDHNENDTDGDDIATSEKTE